MSIMLIVTHLQPVHKFDRQINPVTRAKELTGSAVYLFMDIFMGSWAWVLIWLPVPSQRGLLALLHKGLAGHLCPKKSHNFGFIPGRHKQEQVALWPDCY